MRSIGAAILVLCVSASGALADAPAAPRVTITKHTIAVERSLSVGMPAKAAAGAMLYSEKSIGNDVVYLDAPFSHHPMLAPNLDITTDDPLAEMTVDGVASVCTTRSVGRGNLSFVCFADTDHDGSVDHWQTLRPSGAGFGGYVRPQDLSPGDVEAMPPVHLRKGRAEPKDGEECLIEIRYAGLVDDKIKLVVSARLANQTAPFKQAELSIAQAAKGPTAIEINFPIDSALNSVALARLLQSAKTDPTAFEALLNGGRRGNETMTIEVTKADAQSIAYTVRKPFRDWQYWVTKDRDGKDVTHMAWGRAAVVPPATAATSVPAPTVAGGVDLVNRDAVAREVFVCGDGCDVLRKKGQTVSLAAGETRKDVCQRECFFVMSNGGFMNVTAIQDEVKAGRVFSGDVVVAIQDGKIVAPAAK